MSIIFDPVPSLDPAEPTRARVTIPIRLLSHFDPTVNLVTPDEKPHYIMRQTHDTTLAIAQKLSTALFGSTQSISDPFLHWVSRFEDGPPEAVTFTLNHGMGLDSADLNPVYLHIAAKPELVEGNVVFGVVQQTGENRERFNRRYEAEEGKMRREAAAERQRAQLGQPEVDE